MCPAAENDRARLLSLYRSRALAQNRLRDSAARISIPDRLDEDRRDLTLYFNTFFTSFLEKTMLRDIRQVAEAPLIFPVIDHFDAGCINVGDNPAIFLTSRALDVVELFANTISMCIRLNGVALPGLLAVEAWEGHEFEHVRLAWMTMTPGPPLVQRLNDLLERRTGADLERFLFNEIFVKPYIDFTWWPETVRAALSCYHLSIYLSLLMMHAVNQLVPSSRGDGPAYLGVTDAPIPSKSPMSVDSRYLATLVLTFISLHELGHVLKGHNEIERMKSLWLSPTDAIISRAFDEAFAAAREENKIPIVDSQDPWDTTLGNEWEADHFALRVVDDPFRREPLLEAATLWCAVLESSNKSPNDWIADLFKKPLASSYMAYPPFAMRTWYLNGAFSFGARRGEIAREITRQAEEVPDQLSLLCSTEQTAEVFRALWRIAKSMVNRLRGVNTDNFLTRSMAPGAVRSPRRL